MPNPKKIIIVVGTRPNFIKVTQFDKEFAKFGSQFDYKLVHTGQHYDYNMSDIFFQQLQIRKPDYFLGTPSGSPTFQIGMIMVELEKVFDIEKPDLVIVVGDVNSTFAAAFTAYKKGIKLAHLESGLRSNDRNMPEEINRILTDEISDLFFVTESSGLKSLKENGKTKNQVKFVGNTMIDTLVAFDGEIDKADILEKLDLQIKNYALITIHRPSNVDEKENLTLTINILTEVAKKLKVVFPIHPRTLKKAEEFGIKSKLTENSNIILTEPLDYFAFQKLVKNCCFVLTDSGGIQEETTFRQVPCLTLRKNTERPSTVEIGSNELLEFDIKAIMNKVEEIIAGKFKKGSIPPLWDGKATERIVQVLAEIV
ncbi:MAG: non-hydrolyzing UDP-N-acetylglucosamine 2-epimerase [Cytophagales bacterium]